MSQFTPEKEVAVRSFRDDGAVVLLGSGVAPPEATANLNALADELDTRLRVGEDRVTDATNNVAGDPALTTTTDVVISLEPPRNPGRGNGRDDGRGPRDGGSDGGRGRGNDNGHGNGCGCGSDDDGAGDGRGPGGKNGRGPGN